jgi:hypothetical protein
MDTSVVMDAAAVVRKTLQRTHRIEDYTLTVPLELLRQARNTRLLFIAMMGMIAAISLGGFFCWWAARSPKPRLARTALVIGFAGLFADFFSDALFIGWLPERYASLAPFTTFVSEVVANGLYSIAGTILMLASPPMRPGFRAWGWIVWIAGFALVAAGAMRWDAAIVVSSGVLLAVFIGWVSVATRFLGES